jgi:hypothetical protein
VAICKRPPRKIKDLWTFKELPKIDPNSILKVLFLCFCVVPEVWQHADFMFSVFENDDLSIESTLLSLISSTLKNHWFACFWHILMSITRSELRFYHFLKQYIFGAVKGKFQSSITKTISFCYFHWTAGFKNGKQTSFLKHFLWSNRFIARESDLTKWMIFFEIVRNALG